MTNQDLHLDCAQGAVQTHADGLLRGRPDSRAPASKISDLITDLLHLADSKRLDAINLAKTAISQYLAETGPLQPEPWRTPYKVSIIVTGRDHLADIATSQRV